MTTRPDENFIPTWETLRKAWMKYNHGGMYSTFVEKHEYEVGFDTFRSEMEDELYLEGQKNFFTDLAKKPHSIVLYTEELSPATDLDGNEIKEQS